MRKYSNYAKKIQEKAFHKYKIVFILVFNQNTNDPKFAIRIKIVIKCWSVNKIPEKRWCHVIFQEMPILVNVFIVVFQKNIFINILPLWNVNFCCVIFLFAFFRLLLTGEGLNKNFWERKKIGNLSTTWAALSTHHLHLFFSHISTARVRSVLLH